MSTQTYTEKSAKSSGFLENSPLRQWRERQGLETAELADVLSHALGSVWHDTSHTIQLLEEGWVGPSSLEQVVRWLFDGIAPGLMEAQARWHLGTRTARLGAPKTDSSNPECPPSAAPHLERRLSA